MTSQPMHAAFGEAAAKELDAALHRIHHCMQQLSDDQLWWRPTDAMNSIANLLLHLSGNVRQWIISGIGGEPDLRDRQQEFDATGPIPRAELWGGIERTVSEAKLILTSVTHENLLRNRRIQGFEVNGIQAVIHSVAHFQGHVQEIVHMTRCQLSEKYCFEFVPPSAPDAR